MGFRKWAKNAGRAVRKRYGSKGGTGRLVRDVAFLKSVVNVERKFIDLVSNGYTLQASSTGALLLLNGVGQGTNLTDRIGDSVLVKSIYIEGFLQLNTSTQDLVRLQIVLDRQANGASPAWSDVYENTTPACCALRNKLTTNRFRVLTQRILTLNNNGDQLVRFKMFIPLRKFHTKYNGTGATIASLYTNALYFSLSGNVTTNMSVAAFTARVRFIDN